MFDNLTGRLKSAFKHLTGQKYLSESNIEPALAEVRRSLIEADVALPVVRQFIADVKEKALGKEIEQGLNPEQQFISIVNDVLIKTMGGANEELNLRTQPPAVVLMAGLQGAGKTTSVAKLAKLLKEEKKKKVLVVSADVYRPAAITQLQTLAHQIEVDFYPSSTEQKPFDIVTAALQAAKKGYYDVLIVDTAGRLHVDEAMMEEIKSLHAALKPIETLFTVDAMTGQDAANTAKAFNEALPLTGVILTKLDGDARGGAALSIRHITGKPIKFLGVGEKTDALEPFHPDRIASRILDMGDMLTLIEKLRKGISEEQIKKQSKKLSKGNFGLQDFLQQMESVNGIGVKGMLSMLPGMSQVKEQLDEVALEKKMAQTKAIIYSMTLKEREHPEILKASRKLRIAAGAGVQVQDINRLLQDFERSKQVMKMLSSNGLGNLMGMLGKGGFGGGMPGMGGLGGMFGGGKRRK